MKRLWLILALVMVGCGGNPTPPLTILTTTLPDGVSHFSYEVRLQASGGKSPYKWKITGLPEGLTYDPATGVISGIPANVTEDTTWEVQITVSDSSR